MSNGVMRQPIPANSRADAIIKFVRDNEEMINAANTLRVEMNFNGAEMVVKAERGFKVAGEFSIRGSPG